MIQTDKRASMSHDVHEKHIIDFLQERERCFFPLINTDSVSYVLNIRTLKILEPLLKTKNTWLTVGDINGFEAKYFNEHNQNAIASDISDAILKEVKAEGLINEYRKENVEHLTLEEDSIDYVSCREAFHHFPRAYLGLYEMIRVAKKGVVLIEPIDILAKMPLLLLIKNVCDWFNPLLINKIWKNRFSWEPVGNYVFKISEREIEKIAMGIGLPCIAFKYINVLLYINFKETEAVPVNQKLLKKLNKKIRFKDFICSLKLIPHNTLCSIVFKEMPDNEMLKNLRNEGYKIIQLPPNPYI